MQMLQETCCGRSGLSGTGYAAGNRGYLQLTLAQNIRVTGAVVATTPQDIAPIDAKRYRDVREGGSAGARHCGKYIGIFVATAAITNRSFGIGRRAEAGGKIPYQLLGQMPLHISLREDPRRGTPTVVGAVRRASLPRSIANWPIALRHSFTGRVK